jgi:hypothetical protein
MGDNGVAGDVDNALSVFASHVLVRAPRRSMLYGGQIAGKGARSDMVQLLLSDPTPSALVYGFGVGDKSTTSGE